jgi:hypothetical protein
MVTTAAREKRTLLEAAANLSQFHRRHEQFYGSSPREVAVRLQRHARTLDALADRWSDRPRAPEAPAMSPYEGCEDLNAAEAVQLDGVLFMEGGARPVEIDGLVRDLREVAQDQLRIGDWLTTAMDSSWAIAGELTAIDELADVLGERHRIIANDRQAAGIATTTGLVLDRAADILDSLDLAPGALRADIAGNGATARKLYSVAEMIDHAADLCSESAGLVHANERRWRIFRGRVTALLAALDEPDPTDR